VARVYYRHEWLDQDRTHHNMTEIITAEYEGEKLQERDGFIEK
jgi:hypothetical protein